MLLTKFSSCSICSVAKYRCLEGPMFLGTRKSNGEHYLCLLQSYRVPGKPYPRTKVIYNFGKLSYVSGQTKEWLANKELRAQLAEAVTLDIEAGLYEEANRKVVLGKWSVNNSQKNNFTNFNKLPRLHYGHITFKKMWDYEFNLKYKFNYIQKNSTTITSWNISDLIFYLSTSKILNPSSYHKLYTTKEFYLYCPWEKITIDAYYSVLDILSDNMDDIIKYAVSSYIDKRKTQVSIAFFDCTNTWFETQNDDKTKLNIDYYHEIIDKMRKQGKSEDEISKYLCSKNYEKDLEKIIQKNQDKFLRMRGNSKEGRYMQPLVTIALVIDQEGFPIDLHIFPGNLSEMHKVSPVINALKNKYNIKNIYFIADKGLNSTSNLNNISCNGLGYVVAQKVVGQKESVEKEILDISGYKNCIIKGNKLEICDNSFDEYAFRFKVCDCEKSAYVERDDGKLTKSGKSARKRITIKSKIMYIFSPDRQKHDLADLQNQVTRAQKAVQDGLSLGNPYQTGWRSLLQTEREAQAKKKEDGKKEDIQSQYRAVGLKQEVIARRERLAGYSAIVFSHPQDGFQLSDVQILSAYHQLVGIEDCFRVMKSNFSIRPMFVRLYSRIRGHCCICFLALMLLRALQNKLEKENITLSSDKIAQALWSATVVAYPGNYGELSLFNITDNDSAYSIQRVGKGKLQQDINLLEDSDHVWGAYSRDRLANPDDTDTIMRVVGLEPLPMKSNLAQAKKALRIGSLNDDIILADVISKRLGIAKQVLGAN